MSSAESNFLAWLRKADHDLLNIENNLAAKEIPWDTICFHAEQAVEKILKAFLVHQGSDLSKTHDLVALLAQCVGHEASLNALETDCRKLTSYGVTARYPDDLFEPGEERWPRGRGGGLPSPPENPHTLTDRPLAFSNS